MAAPAQAKSISRSGMKSAIYSGSMLSGGKPEGHQSNSNAPTYIDDTTDYLSLAAQAKHAGLQALKKGLYDVAWGCFHEQKEQYVKQATRSRFSKRDFLALDSTVSEHLANVLRAENKHKLALVHITYWVLAHRHRPTKSQANKFKAYFNRCKFEGVTLAQAESDVAAVKPLANYPEAQELVARWAGEKS